MGYKVIFNALLVLLCYFVNFFEVNAQNDKLRFKYLSLKDGLQSLSIISTMQDYKGFMWFGTEDGLHRYDGYEFTVYSNDPDDSTSLIDNNICGIIEDKEKKLWIGTTFGLELFNRDANSFIHIPVIEETASAKGTVYSAIKKYFVNNLCEDKDGNIFVCTRGNSLYKLDKKNNCVRPFAKQFTFNENLVRSSDSLGNIWITSQQGVYKFNIHSYKIDHFTHINNDPTTLASNKVFYAYVDKYDNVWIATDKGLNKINPTTGQMKCYTHDKNNSFSIPSYFINQIYEDRYNNLWFCTEYGLCRFDQNNDNFVNYNDNTGDENGLTGNKVKCIYVDRQGILWVGLLTVGIGYAKLINPYSFETIRISAFNKNGLDINAITAIFKDKEDNLWLGTDGGGLYFVDKKTNKYKFYYNNQQDSKTVGSNVVLAIFQDSSGDMWIGTYYGGFSKLNKNDGTFDTYKLDVPNPISKSQVSNDVRSILEDRQGNLVIATNGDGINIFNKKQKTSKHIFYDPDNPNSLSSNYCTTLYKDSEGIIWIGTYNGLCKWNDENNSFTNYMYDKNTWSNGPNLFTNYLGDNNAFFIYSILEDSKHNLWIGTMKGLYGLNRKTQKLSNYTRKNGLPNDVINGILEDKQDNLWISTNHGISKFNISTKQFKNYDADYGLQGNQFIHGSYFLDKSGEMYFGGMDGLTKFKPENVKDNKDIPAVYITEFKLLGNTVKAGDKGSPLTRHISETKQITLKYNQSFISFKYIALNYLNSRQIKYAYIMEGFDKYWHYVGNERIATYTNLDPGEYTFKVKACNNDGYWNEQGSSIHLIVKPPIWSTIWAYIFYLLVTGIVIYGILRFFRFQDKIKQQLEIQRIEADKQHKLDMFRLRFFTNISHEFRTPLTLILGPAERIIENLRNNAPIGLPLAETIWRNSHRLLKLVNQLLDFRKIDSGTERLNLVETNIVKFIADIFDLFQYQADYREINYRMNIVSENFITCFDPDKIEKVVYNLLSNAIKYTPEKGSVKLTISETLAEDDLKILKKNGLSIFRAVKIEISDTGIGIADAEKEKIFDPFYQVNQKILNKNEGSGIGLSIVKEYINMHNGEIFVKDNAYYHSDFKEGTTFIVFLPVILNDDNLNTGNSENNVIQSNYPNLKDFLIDLPKMDMVFETSFNNSENLPVVLIVDDNFEMRSFLKSELINQFQIIEASNGKEGHSIAVKEIPDLIISDIMMSEVSGIELCKQIKTDIRTSHIPVILLTALSEDEYKIEGLETGADDYLTKPFNLDLLVLRIKNLIETRKQLQEKFSQNVNLNNKTIIKNSTDQKFMEKIIGLVERNIENPNIDIEQFTQEAGMSRTQLYKKIKAITGQTVFEFNYTIRLKKAADILLNENVSVTEVAARVGYSNLSVFTRSFTRQFKINPSKYSQIYNPQNGNS